MSYTYNSGHFHAVSSLSNGNTYSYDANGNMTNRHVYEGGNWKNYTLAYDAENHLTAVSGDATASFGYDSDGKRIVATEGGVTTAYIGNYFEWNESAGTLKKYYYAGATRIAMRTGSGDAQFLLSDHLGSTTKILNYDGSSGASDRGYKPWGEVRFGPEDYPTGYQFTGQYRDKLIGLYYYGARWYDTTLGRFVQPDSIIVNSENPQSWDRYAYVLNNPLKYIDPSGHYASEPLIDGLYSVDYAVNHANEIGECPPGQDPMKSLDDPAWRGWIETTYINKKYGLTAIAVAQTTEINYFLANTATLLDSSAMFLNIIYMVVTTLLGVINPVLGSGLLSVYPVYSFLPNMFSFAAMTIWIALDSLNGNNKYSIINSEYGPLLSVNIGLDTLISITTNSAGLFLLKDPYSASFVDTGVLAYDLCRITTRGNTTIIPEISVPFLIFSQY